MTTNPEEPIETIELSPEDAADLEQLYAEADGGTPPEFHTVLEVWREVLQNAPAELEKPVTPAWSARMCSEYREIRYADTQELHHRYMTKIMDLAKILDAQIAEDKDALIWRSPEDDVENNADAYRNLLLNWQKAFMMWELDWRCFNHDAAVELAAISEVHKMFFGATGLTQFLDNIKFEFTEADQAMLRETLQEMRDEAEVGGE